MKRRYLGTTVCGWTLLIGCGGNAASTNDQSKMEMRGAGGNPQDSRPGGQAGAMQPGTAGTAQGEPPYPGSCTKLCVPQASFILDSRASLGELRSGTLHACRNEDLECYEGTLPSAGSGNTISFGMQGGWSGPSAFSEDDWKTLHFTWSGLEAQPPLRDNDRFALTLEQAGGQVVLLDRVVQFETVHDCAGSCINAFFDLRGETGGVGGTPSTETGGASGTESGGASGSGEAGAVP